MMNIFLFGASGATGAEVLTLLLSKAHHVRVLVRTPERFNYPSSKNLTVIKGDVTVIGTFEHALADIDVVISTLGTGTNRKPTNVYSVGGQNIINAMHAKGVTKLIILTAAAFDLTDPGNDNFIVRFIVRPLFKNIYSDMILFEQLLNKNLDIDWVCIRPTRLTSKSYTGKYRISLNHSRKGGNTIGRKDLADFIVKEIQSNEYIHLKPVIAY